MDSYTTPEWNRSALITIDTQCDTLDDQPLEVPGTSAILPRMRLLLDAFRSVGLPIIHIVRLYRPDGSNVDLCRRAQVEQGEPLLLTGTSGCQLAPEILPDSEVKLDETLLLANEIQAIGSNEVIIYKSRWGAFYQTPLEAHLKKLGVTTLVFSGCNFPNCPRTSIYQASERDFRLVLAEDAISGLYEQGCNELKNIGVALMPSKQIVEALDE